MVIIDFDDTIFNTQAFKRARIEALERVGVSEELYHETYMEARQKDSVLIYSDEAHADALAGRGFSRETVLATLESLAGTTTYLFEDSSLFIESLKRRNASLVLLSLGAPAFQEKKIHQSGLENVFDQKYITNTNKADVLLSLLVNEVAPVWFINDKVDETRALAAQFPKLKPVLHVSSAIAEEEYQKSGLPYFKTLTEIFEYVTAE